MYAFAFILVMICWLFAILTAIAHFVPDRVVDKVLEKLSGGKPFEPYDRD